MDWEQAIEGARKGLTVQDCAKLAGVPAREFDGLLLRAEGRLTSAERRHVWYQRVREFRRAQAEFILELAQSLKDAGGQQLSSLVRMTIENMRYSRFEPAAAEEQDIARWNAYAAQQAEVPEQDLSHSEKAVMKLLEEIQQEEARS